VAWYLVVQNLVDMFHLVAEYLVDQNHVAWYLVAQNLVASFHRVDVDLVGEYLVAQNLVDMFDLVAKYLAALELVGVNVQGSVGRLRFVLE